MATRKTPKKRTWAEIKAAKKPPSTTVPVRLDADTLIHFTFHALGRADFKAIIEKYEEKDTDKWPMGYDPDVLGPVLIAACLVEPEMAVEEVQEMYADEAWSFQEVNKLWLAAMRINSGVV